MGIAKVKDLLEDDDEWMDELKDIQLDPDVEFEKEPTPTVLNMDPTVWSEEYDVDPMMFLKEWGEELGGPSATTEPIVVILPTSISQIPSTSDMDTPPSILPHTSDHVSPPLSDETNVKNGEVV
ncbi:hypothetical protein Dimus_010772 [Dionaea muscipula]